MNKKGFTLAELLGVIVILGLIALIAFPPMLNNIKGNQDNINEATLQIIYSAANIYINNNPSEFGLVEDEKYCIKLQTLIDSGELTGELIDPNTSKKIDPERYVKVLFKGGKYTYTVIGKDC